MGGAGRVPPRDRWVANRFTAGIAATPIDIRPAVLDDLPRIFAIYNREVEGGVATFDIEPREPGRDDGWLTDRAPYHPVTVAVARRRGGRLGIDRSLVAARRLPPDR